MEVGDLEKPVRRRPIVTGLVPVFDVAPNTEGAVALAGEDDRANGVVSPRPLERVDQLLDGLGAKGVEAIGAVDGDDGHRAVDLIDQVFVVHLSSPARAKCRFPVHRRSTW